MSELSQHFYDLYVLALDGKTNQNFLQSNIGIVALSSEDCQNGSILKDSRSVLLSLSTKRGIDFDRC